MSAAPETTQLILMEKSIDDPRSAQNAYARYAFPTMLRAVVDPRNPNSKSWAHRTTASWIATTYFVASFNNSPPAQSNASETDKWTNALWDIRNACGQSFTDRALYYALKSFDDEGGRSPQQESKQFSEYFARRILAGVWVVDNQLSRLETVNQILKSHELMSAVPAGQ